MTQTPNSSLDASGAQAEEARRERVSQLAAERTDAERSGAALEQLIAFLGDESWRVRKAALDAVLLYHPNPRLVPALVQSLASQDNAGLRNAAAEVLTRIGAPAIVELSRALVTQDADLQKFAIDVLGEIGSAEAVPTLISTLQDADENVRAAAAEALGKIGSIDAIDALWKCARETADLLMKLSSLEALAKLGAPGPFEQLSEFSKNRFVAKPAYALLSVCPDPRAIDLLAEGITGTGRSLRVQALMGLARRMQGEVAGERALIIEALKKRRATLLPVLVEFLRATDEAEVRAAIALLGALGEPSMAKPILEAFTQEGLLDVAEQALIDLGHAALPYVAEALPGIPDAARELAASTLALHGHEQARSILISALLSGDLRTREIAATVLQRTGDLSTVEQLLNALQTARADEASVPLVEGVLKTLALRHSKEAKSLVAVYLNEKTAYAPVFWRLFAAVCELGDVPQLCAALKDERAPIRAAAVGGLSRQAAPEARDALLMSLSDESAQVRQMAADGLRYFTDDNVRDALMVAVSDEDMGVATVAAGSLGHFHSAVVKDKLADLASADRTPVVIAAISALSALDPLAAAQLLPKLLGDKDGEVVKEAVRVIMPLVPIEAAKFFERVLDHHLWDVRYVAAQTLAPLSGARPMLERRLRIESDALVKQALEQALAAK